MIKKSLFAAALFSVSSLLSGCYITPAVPPKRPPRADCREVVVKERVCVKSVDRVCVRWKRHKRVHWDC